MSRDDGPRPAHPRTTAEYEREIKPTDPPPLSPDPDPEALSALEDVVHAVSYHRDGGGYTVQRWAIDRLSGEAAVLAKSGGLNKPTAIHLARLGLADLISGKIGESKAPEPREPVLRSHPDKAKGALRLSGTEHLVLEVARDLRDHGPDPVLEERTDLTRADIETVREWAREQARAGVKDWA